MTDDSLQDKLMQFWDENREKLGLGEFSDELTRLVQGLLSKKDQEHRAELEGIKDEIDRIPRNLYNGGEGDGYNQGIQDAISIIDSRIEKTVANTE